MKLTTSILVLGLAPLMWAQAGPINAARNAAAVASSNTERTNRVMDNKASAQAAKSATQSPTATPAQTPKASAQLQSAVSAQTPTAKKAKKSSAGVATAVKKELEKPEAAQKPAFPRQSRRDPFVSVIRSDTKGPGNPCVSGKKCLAINEIVLRGIVKSPNAVIAVVENPQKKTYFLRENDPVLNGEVVKITSDSVVFHERSTDKLGRVNTKEITKTVDTRPIA